MNKKHKEKYRMSEEEFPIDKIKIRELDKAVLEDLKKRFPKRYALYDKILDKHPELFAGDVSKLKPDELAHFYYCELMESLEIFFANFKASDFEWAFYVLEPIKQKIKNLEVILLGLLAATKKEKDDK